MSVTSLTSRVRKAARVLLGSYEGASKRRRADHWRAPASGPNTAMQYDLPTLRARSRDLVRNHWAASRGVSVIAHNTVGAGIIPTAKRSDGTHADDIERALVGWADTTHCDAMGRLTLYGLQSLVMRTVAEAGECLVLRERVGTGGMRRMGLEIPIQLRVLEPDYLDIQKDGPQPDGNFAIHGVEFSPQGRPVAYHIYQEHPGETARWSSLQSVRVPAEDVAHIYRITRPGQARGVPWLAPVMIRMRDFDEYEQAQLMRQKIAATFAVFVRNLKGEPSAEEGESFSLKPGMVRWLEPGEDVTFANPPGVTGYADYARVNLRAIASGLGITYEALTADYSQVNYSSARMAHLEMLANINDVRHNMLIPQMCFRIESWVKEACESVGIAADGTVWEWTAPRREMLDPTKEVGAMIKAIRAGLTSRQDEIRKLGRDSAEVLREIAEDNAIADELGLILDSDPRGTTAAGLTPVGSYINAGDAEDTDE
jgi:lambda family phage portal protein